MKIWVIENGEKSGPYDSFALREKIEAGELPAETLAWYQGAEDWMPIKDVPVLSQLYETKEITEEEIDPAELIMVDLEQLTPPPLKLVRRFFARFFDMSLYFSVLLIVTQDASVLNIGTTGMGWHLGLGCGYVLLDALMIHLWSSSPGKWLLGVQVTSMMRERLRLWPSLMRALRVWVLGWGMWLIAPIAVLISGLMAWRLKYLVWDYPRRYRVDCLPLKWSLVVRYTVAMLSMAMLLEATASDDLLRQMQEISQQFHEQMKGAGE